MLIKALKSGRRGHVQPFDSSKALEGLDKPSADHDAMSPDWLQSQAIVNGLRAMRDGRETYLPKFEDESEKNYNIRLSMNKMTNVYRDVLENLASKPFEVDIVLADSPAAPPQIVEFIKDVDGAGNTISIFAADSFLNGINQAIDWIFVDFPVILQTGQPRSIADEQKLGIKPFWTHVRAQNVLEIKEEIIAGSQTLTYFRMVEFKNGVKYVRIMTRVNNIASFELYKQIKDDVAQVARWEIVNSGPITIGLIPMFPFVTGRRRGRSWVFDPVLRDASDLQVNLYQNETALEHSKRMAAYVMIAANGVKPEMIGTGIAARAKAIPVGPMAVLYAPPDGNGNHGTFSLLEPSATSMAFLQSDNAATINQIREIGRNPLTAQSGNITVVTAGVAAQKSVSAVKMWAKALENALNEALICTALWYGLDYDATVKVFDDFDVDTSGADLETLNTARANGDISQKTYWRELERRNVLGTGFDADQELTELLDETPGNEVDNEGNPIDLVPPGAAPILRVVPKP